MGVYLNEAEELEIEEYENYLEHHGVVWQEWRVRNGPPYPLSAGAHSAKEKKAGWRKSLDNTAGTGPSKKRAKAYQKGLNKLDRKSGKLAVKSERDEKKVSKALSKAAKRNPDDLDYQNLDERTKKLLDERFEDHSKIAEIENERYKLIEQALSEGYSVSSKQYRDIVLNGRTVLTAILGGGIIAGALGDSADFNKYKVKMTDDQENPTYSSEISKGGVKATVVSELPSKANEKASGADFDGDKIPVKKDIGYTGNDPEMKKLADRVDEKEREYVNIAETISGSDMSSLYKAEREYEEAKEAFREYQRKKSGG